MIPFLLWAICTINQPCSLEVNSPYTGTVVAYDWRAKDQPALFHVTDKPSDKVEYIWDTLGDKWVLVFVFNPQVSGQGGTGTVKVGKVRVVLNSYFPIIKHAKH